MNKFFKHFLIGTFLLILTACGSGGGGAGFGLNAIQNGGMQKSAGDDALGDSDGISEGSGGNQDNANKNANPNHDPGTAQYNAPVEPFEIPITVAKSKKAKPDVSKITVKVETDADDQPGDDNHHDAKNSDDHQGENGQSGGPKKMVKYSMMMSGAPGAIEDPVDTPFVYLYNPATLEEVFVKVEADGSFQTEEIQYEVKKPFVVAATDKETISEPVIFRANNARVYSFREYQTNTPIQTTTFVREDTRQSAVTLSYRRDTDVEKTPAVQRDLSSRPVITLTDENGEVRHIDDQRVMTDNSVIYRTDKGLFEISEDRLQTLTTFDTNEKITRWDVLKTIPDTRLTTQDKNDEGRTQRLIGILSDQGIRLVDSQRNRLVFDKGFKEISAETSRLIARDADMNIIVDSILKNNLVMPETQSNPIIRR